MLSPHPPQKNYMFLQVQSAFTSDRHASGGKRFNPSRSDDVRRADGYAVYTEALDRRRQRQRPDRVSLFDDLAPKSQEREPDEHREDRVPL
jgi:hypothetical protein